MGEMGKMKPITCDTCGTVQDGWAEVNDDGAPGGPTVGSLMICVYCGGVNEIMPGWLVRGLTDDEFAVFIEDHPQADFINLIRAEFKLNGLPQ